VNLDTILLEPCGTFLLDVVNGSGFKVHAATVLVNGKTPSRSQYFEHRNQMMYDKLPMGSAALRISADGFLDKEITTFLKPGELKKIRVILKEKP
jgi:hypothetical protein